MIWCDGTADWAVRLDPTEPISIGSRPPINKRRSTVCASEKRRVHAHARVREVDPVTAVCFPTNVPRGAEKTKRKRAVRTNPLRSRPTRNVQRFSLLNTDTQSRGATYMRLTTGSATAVEIVENCDLHARHTPVSTDDSSRNIKGGEREGRYGRGADFEALSGYEKIRIMSVMNGICIVYRRRMRSG